MAWLLFGVSERQFLSERRFHNRLLFDSPDVIVFKFIFLVIGRGVSTLLTERHPEPMTQSMAPPVTPMIYLFPGVTLSKGANELPTNYLKLFSMPDEWRKTILQLRRARLMPLY
jgi:hypothetical protein